MGKLPITNSGPHFAQSKWKVCRRPPIYSFCKALWRVSCLSDWNRRDAAVALGNDTRDVPICHHNIVGNISG